MQSVHQWHSWHVSFEYFEECEMQLLALRSVLRSALRLASDCKALESCKIFMYQLASRRTAV